MKHENSRCEECDYRTGDHNSLRRHKMRHSGARPYRCPFCKYCSIQGGTDRADYRPLSITIGLF